MRDVISFVISITMNHHTATDLLHFEAHINTAKNTQTLFIFMLDICNLAFTESSINTPKFPWI